MKLTIRRKEGEPIPFGYGLVTEDFYSFSTIFMPIPLNYIYRAWLRMLWNMKPDRFDERIVSLRHKYYSMGLEEGRKATEERAAVIVKHILQGVQR